MRTPVAAVLALLLTVTAAAPAVGVEPGVVNRTSLAVEAAYDVSLALSFADRTLAAAETIVVTNRSGAGIDRLELNTVLPRLGGLKIHEATLDDIPVQPVVEDQTITVPFGSVLPDGAVATIRIRFSARFGTRLGGSHWLFTAAGGALAAYRWLPWVSRARPFDRPNHGDPFVTAVSPSVTLEVVTDRPTRLAVNARRTFISGDGRTQRFAAADVRDLTFVADSRFGAVLATVGDTRVLVFARTAAARTRLRTLTVRTFARLEGLLGAYPWPTLTVAETRGGYAVESPGAIWIPSGAPDGNLPWLVAHELAHQWFYGVVGNDQAHQPFADEAVADLLARHVTGTLRRSRCATDRLDRSIYRYSAACYFEVVYIQGGRLLNEVRVRVGDRAFFLALRRYVAAHRFGFGSTRELIAALDRVDTRDLASKWATRFPSLLP